jgi:hypothetical protein
MAKWHRTELRKLLSTLPELWQAKSGTAVASWASAA